MGDWIKQFARILSEIVSNLRGHPVLLFGLASMILGIVSIWVLSFATIPLPERLMWFPYALLGFGITIILIAPIARDTEFSPSSLQTVVPYSLEGDAVTTAVARLLMTRLGRVSVVMLFLELLWGVYLGNRVGYGISDIVNSAAALWNETPPTQSHPSLIVGSTLVGLFMCLSPSLLIVIEYTKSSRQLEILGELVLVAAAETLGIPLVAVFFSPISALVWWLSNGNSLIAVVATASVLVLVCGGLISAIIDSEKK